jgi:hypothetical protein
MARQIVKKVKNAILYDDGCVRIDGVVCSYPHLDKPWKKNDGDREKYSVTGLAPKETHGEAKALLVEMINNLLTSNKMGKIGAEHKFVRNGDTEDGPLKPETENMWIIKSSENPDRPPKVRDQLAKLMSPEKIAKTIYAGCIINILIRPWAQDNKHGKKINANLVGVQFVRDGTRIGEAAIDDDDAWDELEVEVVDALGQMDDDEDL